MTPRPTYHSLADLIDSLMKSGLTYEQVIYQLCHRGVKK